MLYATLTLLCILRFMWQRRTTRSAHRNSKLLFMFCSLLAASFMALFLAASATAAIDVCVCCLFLPSCVCVYVCVGKQSAMRMRANQKLSDCIPERMTASKREVLQLLRLLPELCMFYLWLLLLLLCCWWYLWQRDAAAASNLSSSPLILMPFFGAYWLLLPHFDLFISQFRFSPAAEAAFFLCVCACLCFYVYVCLLGNARNWRAFF